jgi:hypothetical protein
LHQVFMRFLSGSIPDWQKNQLFKYWSMEKQFYLQLIHQAM